MLRAPLTSKIKRASQTISHLQLQIHWLFLRQRNDSYLGDLVDFVVTWHLANKHFLTDQYETQRKICQQKGVKDMSSQAQNKHIPIGVTTSAVLSLSQSAVSCGGETGHLAKRTEISPMKKHGLLESEVFACCSLLKTYVLCFRIHLLCLFMHYLGQVTVVNVNLFPTGLPG